MEAFDSAILTIVLNENSDIPEDPATGKPVERARERIDFLIETLSQRGEQILIPMPALSEVLVVAGDAGLRYVKELQDAAVFRIEPFDIRAAIELAQITRQSLDVGDKKGGVDAPWQLIKIDRQIAAIAKASGARRLHTNDGKLAAFAKEAGLEAVPLQDLPLPPPQDAQLTMDALLRPALPAPEPQDESDEAEIDLAAALDAAIEEADEREPEPEGQPESPSGEIPPSGTGA